MGGLSQKEPKKESKKQVCAALLAHVDAGKTTLAESILYESGNLAKLGRVDHGDAFLDTYEMEKERGITIFSKQARITLGDLEVTLLDTPGHVDFCAEMERTLQILDYAILVISGADGVQGHTETLWRLLKRYQVPVFLFINKMDQEGCDRGRLLEELKKRLDERCIFFGEEADRSCLEEISLCSESLLEEYLETGGFTTESIRDAIQKREIYPCYFGSALKLTGVKAFLEGLKRYMSPYAESDFLQEFGARVFKISRDAQGTRLTHMKITGGSLKVKTVLGGEKINQIRLYNGASYQAVEEVFPGMICAVTGLNHTYSGQGLGKEEGQISPLLEPVLTYCVNLPDGYDAYKMLLQLKVLEEEIPEMHVIWKEAFGEIQIQVMGEVQIQILKRLIRERFHADVQFGSGSIIYKETIAAPAEGIGHFEPLRHYAEVHLLLEPGEAGSGLTIETAVSEDELDKNWQRLVMTHLKERSHPGVLTGSEITDMKITLIAGRAHIKHTEGGDFRQAVYRALRQGLRKTPCILLEPCYTFRLEVPAEQIGRAMTDLKRMRADVDVPVTEGEKAVLEGRVAVAAALHYPLEVTSYTRGRGKISLVPSGYIPCENAQDVIEKIGYDPEKDTENPTGSVFCAHGAGFLVPWDQVDAYAHIQTGISKQLADKAQEYRIQEGQELLTGWNMHDSGAAVQKDSAEKRKSADEELETIFNRTYGEGKWNPGKEADREFKRRPARQEQENAAYTKPVKKKPEPMEEYLLVDGYNIIFAWEDLRELAKVNIDSARGKLKDILCDYQGYTGVKLILVFDAYKVKGGVEKNEKYHNIDVVYTKEAQTADQYIERTVHEIGKKYHVTVATSDGLEQLIIWGQGAYRMSAAGFREEIERVKTFLNY